MNVRPAGPHEMNVSLIQSRSFGGQQTGVNFNSRCAQMSKAATGNLRVGIFDGCDDTFDSRFDKRVRTGLGAAAMRVRFQRDVSSSTARSISRLFQGDRFGMLYPIVNVKAFAGDLSTGVCDDGAD